MCARVLVQKEGDVIESMPSPGACQTTGPPTTLNHVEMPLPLLRRISFFV